MRTISHTRAHIPDVWAVHTLTHRHRDKGLWLKVRAKPHGCKSQWVSTAEVIDDDRVVYGAPREGGHTQTHTHINGVTADDTQHSVRPPTLARGVWRYVCMGATWSCCIRIKTCIWAWLQCVCVCVCEKICICAVVVSAHVCFHRFISGFLVVFSSPVILKTTKTSWWVDYRPLSPKLCLKCVFVFLCVWDGEVFFKHASSTLRHIQDHHDFNHPSLQELTSLTWIQQQRGTEFITCRYINTMGIFAGKQQVTVVK